MFGGCNPYGGGFGGGCGGCEPERSSYGGSTFVLIVVLFILLIIVGRSFCV
ncbi:YjcZ family sporulation protein [Sporosarcina sp. ANT_H38]|uniref:YjcZ family sporulation protein n=1 Tax=Sporosarcina sp. ANT_H38 TaxID=2597358 RepID=UPI0011F326E3|nr:YjcZ family sporulation protein [Sporosarcina sp. ANT_H38]KAA0966711.1 YjcZ family sporulation protein [Sporosarcina sp. ANT_H38]